MVDQSLVMRKLAELDKYLAQIREFSSVSVHEYANDWKIQRIVERTLQMMIELCIDIAGHIISDEKLRVPTSYADAFKVLHEEGLIDSILYGSMAKMAKFRNIIVHCYDKIDEAIVVNILSRHLEDFVGFRNAVIQTLETRLE